MSPSQAFPVASLVPFSSHIEPPLVPGLVTDEVFPGKTKGDKRIYSVIDLETRYVPLCFQI